MTTSIEPPARPRAIERALAARGAMLLAIAFAHAPLFVTAIDRGPAATNMITVFDGYPGLSSERAGQPLEGRPAMSGEQAAAAARQ
ncbi:hypothetical protein [Nonomuraea sp. SYSU D8015]|uniref:hypothetical protein n=1 Tax=Nonomuraea sp. SYSU D8015 TaxID=2593644 RepID=UPI001660C06B|nr:hypothetical protein [Nonomuraea sp. SYSU D8015]